MGRKNATRRGGKNNTDRASTSSSSTRSSISIASAAPTTRIETSKLDWKRPDDENPPIYKPKVSTRFKWVRGRRWMFQPCRWWPCRTFNMITQVITVFFNGFTTKTWRDNLIVLCLLAVVLSGSWIVMEGLLRMLRPVAAQDANCSIIYVTVPGPIITVSLIGASASDSARGTYYYSITKGSTQWLNSNAPPSLPLVTSITMSTGSLPTNSMSIETTSNAPVTGKVSSGLPATSPELPSTLPVTQSTSPEMSSTLLGVPPTWPISSGMSTVNTSTVSQGMTLISMQSSTSMVTGMVTISESQPTFSLPNPSLPPQVSLSTAVLDSSPSSERSSDTIKAMSSFPSLDSSMTQSFGMPTSSLLYVTSSLLASSSTIVSSINFTSSSTLSSVAIASTLISSRVSSSGISSRLTVTQISTWEPPVPTSSRWANTTMMTTTELPTASENSSIPVSQTSGLSAPWGNLTSSILGVNSSTMGASSASRTPLFITTASRGPWNMSAGDVKTQVISFGNTAYSFVFPSPDITTTVSYWTGSYPIVSGSEPDVPPSTTRSIRQTPLSALPSFEMLKPTGFKTIITTISSVTRTIVADAAEPTSCGEYGNFTLNFDDTSVGPSKNNVLPINGMTNPYHHLFYANGFTYVPDKWEPYPAISQPNVAMFLPFGSLLPNTPFAGSLLPGEFGAGPRASVSAYWFNAFQAYFGCALNGITPCTLRISGYRYDAVLQQEVLAIEQNVTIPACYGYIRCRLTQVFFNNQFRALSGIQFNAYTYHLGIPQIFMMDDLKMEWYNSSCAAGILRIGHHWGPP